MKQRSIAAGSSWLLLIPLVGIVYELLNHNNGQVHTLTTALDLSIPFCKYFIVPYIAWYGMIFLLLFWFLNKDKKLYYSSLAAIILGLLISYGIYSIFQTQVPRPVVQGRDIFSDLTRFVYMVDNPYNDFPSIHVMTSYIIFLGCNEIKKYSVKLSLAAQGLVVLVILSTLFLKQHTLLDVAGGLFLGVALFNITSWFAGLFSKNTNITTAHDMYINHNVVNSKTQISEPYPRFYQ